MTSNTNGKLPRSSLVEVEPGVLLERLTARAYRRAKAALKKQKKLINPAGPGAGYRDLTTQKEMRLGSLGDKKLAAKWQLNSASTVPLALPGYSSHGYGTRIDLLINGSAQPSEATIKTLAKFGFVREFGSADPNHFEHKGQVGTEPVSRAWCIANGLFVQPEK